MINWRKYLNRGLFNIGFSDITPKELLVQRRLPDIKWLKHNYSDRFFADPFILDVTDKTIECLVEEFKFGGLGTINWLTIDKESMELINNVIVLETDTHLSYPAYINIENQIFVYPENGNSGRLSLYKLDKQRKELVFERLLVDEPLIDATIYRHKDTSYLISTKKSDSPFKHAYLYHSGNNQLSFKQIGNGPIIDSITNSRPAGNFFEVDGKLYRPTQDCKGRYGRATRIMQIVSLDPYKEIEVLCIKPTWFKYSLRLHTLNFHDSGLAVIDACGYVHPVMGRILCPIYDLLLKLKGINYYN